METVTTSIAFVDADRLVIDIDSLWISILRSISNTKIHISAIDQLQQCSVYETAYAHLKEACPSLSSEDIQLKAADVNTRFKSYNQLCRPYFGSIEFLNFLVFSLDIDVVLVSAHPDIIMHCLQPILNHLSNKKQMKHILNPEIIVIPLHNDNCDRINSGPLYGIAHSALIGQLSTLHELLFSSSISYIFTPSPKFLASMIATDEQTNWTASIFNNYPRLHIIPSSTLCINDDLDYLNFTSMKNINTYLPTSLNDINIQQLIQFRKKSKIITNDLYPKRFQYPSKVQPLLFHGPPYCPEKQLWNSSLFIEPPLVFEGIVVKGFGRGSSLLGLPTANLDKNDPVNPGILPFPGIYFGIARLIDPTNIIKENVSSKDFDTVMSIGYNPYYDNQLLTVEPYLFYEFNENFHGVKIRLVVIGLLRAEANFSEFAHLIQAIQQDCEVAKILLNHLRKNNPTQFHIFYNLLFNDGNVIGNEIPQ